MAEKILVVDDDPDTLKFLTLFLSKQGYETLSAPDGAIAIRQAHEKQPDLIILDVMMPGMDGFEVARTLRRTPDTAPIPILMFTAKAQVEDKVSGYESGVDMYLTKPSHPVEMQATIKALLARRKTRQEKQEKRAYVVGVMGAKGGLGVSTLALNLAIAYSDTCDKKVIAMETRPGQGSWRDELGITSNYGLEDLLQMPAFEITPDVVQAKLFRSPFDIQLLLVSNEPRNAVIANAGQQYSAIVKNLSQMADLVVIDIGGGFHPAYDELIKLCDEILLITEPQPLTVKRTRHLATDLRSRDFGSSHPLTVISNNRTRAEMTIPMSKMEDSLGQAVFMGITPAPEMTYSSAERQMPVYKAHPNSIMARQFDSLVENINKHIKK